MYLLRTFLSILHRGNVDLQVPTLHQNQRNALLSLPKPRAHSILKDHTHLRPERRTSTHLPLSSPPETHPKRPEPEPRKSHTRSSHVLCEMLGRLHKRLYHAVPPDRVKLQAGLPPLPRCPTARTCSPREQHQINCYTALPGSRALPTTAGKYIVIAAL